MVCGELRGVGRLALLLLCLSGCISPYLQDGDLVLGGEGEQGCSESGDPLSLRCPATRSCDGSARSPERIRVVTWNIKGGRVHGLQAVSDALRALKPDVVLLQEVDVDVARSGSVDQPAELARALGDGFDYVFAPTLTLEGGTYGIAALSRLPFMAASRIPLSNERADEPRTAIDAGLCVGRGVLRLVNHHADTRKDAAAISCSEIAAHLQESRSLKPTIVGADLNLLPSEPGPAAFADAGFSDVLEQRDPAGTFGASRIDYLFADPLVAEHISAARVVQTEASDHELLFMEVTTLSGRGRR